MGPDDAGARVVLLGEDIVRETKECIGAGWQENGLNDCNDDALSFIAEAGIVAVAPRDRAALGAELHRTVL
eukprot:3694168-Pleurochrysis_carterae.AAC.1